MRYTSEKQIIEQTIRALSASSNMKQRYRSETELLKKRLAESEANKFRVGVIGVTSCGKSTMINAILGKSLLYMDMRASSSQLVTCSKSEDGVSRATIYFTDDRNPEVLTGEQCTARNIARYSCEQKNAKNHLQVKALELSVPKYGFPKELMLIDSPGLDAYGLEAHEKLTLENMLPMCDFCICMMSVMSSDYTKLQEVLNTIALYNVPVIIVQNMLDAIKPSLDGRKTKRMIALEYRQQVEKLVNSSKIKNKADVRIVQISALNALKEREKDRPDEAALSQSNYNKLIETVNEVLELTRPRIESNRLTSLRSELVRIIDEGKADISSVGATVTERFQYEGLEKFLTTEYSKLTQNIKAELDKLNTNGRSPKSQKLRTLLEYPKMDQSILDKIHTLISCSEQNILKNCRAFNMLIRETAKALNLDVRNIMAISSFGITAMPLTVQMKKYMKLEKKKGFFNKVARVFGDLFDTDWGYEYTEKIDVDNESTRAQAIKYVGNVQSKYKSILREWSQAPENKMEQIREELSLRRSAYNDRLNAAAAKAELDADITNVVAMLEAIVSGIDTTVKPSGGSLKATDTDLCEKKLTMQLTRAQYNRFLELHGKAVKLNLCLHNTAFREIKKRTGAVGKLMIVGWDTFSMSSFIQRSFGCEVDSNDILKNADKLVDMGAFTYCYAPKHPENSDCSSLVMITNAMQIGQSLKLISDCGIADSKRWDRVFLVLQDLTAAINGSSHKDCVNEMLSIPSTLGIKSPTTLLINDQNIIYQLSAVQAQLSKTTTDKDIVDIINELKKRYPMMCSPQSETTAAEIIKTIFDRREKDVKDKQNKKSRT